MEKYKDIVLLARPDHSYSIYKRLLASSLKFEYISFKLFPRWLQRYIKDSRFSYYDENYTSSFLLTIVHILRTKFGFSFLEKYEKPLFERKTSRYIRGKEIKVLHYWPNFCVESIAKYKRQNPSVKTYADVYYPCELWVLDNIKPYLSGLGLNASMSDVERDAKNFDLLMSIEDNFIVPSKFILDTYKQYYPDKNYIIVPYGISIWCNYKKKNKKKDSSEVTKFVYVGSVSVEKGCLLLFDFFSKNTSLELHIFGALNSSQEALLRTYFNFENISYHGIVPNTELQEHICKYDVGIHLSLFDAYSLAVGEILGAGLPVIVSNKTGISDLIEKINSGIVTELDDESIKNSVEKIRDVDFYNRCIDNLDVYIQSNPVSYGDSVIQFYQSVL